MGAAIPLREPLPAARAIGVDPAGPRPPLRSASAAGAAQESRAHDSVAPPHDGQESGVFVARRVVTAGATEEEQLIARAVGGDTDAFRVLYTRHRSDVARLVFRMVGAQADLDDVVQEVFFQVFRSLKDFRGQAKFSTWLHRVTVNVVLMHRRAARSRPTYTEETPQDVTPDEENVGPDEDAARRERVRAFSRLLDRLADKKRIVFVLHELEGMAPAEIAKVVGAPVLTVRTRLFYARREIEAMLAEEPALASLAPLVGAGAGAAGGAGGAGGGGGADGTRGQNDDGEPSGESGNEP